MDDPSQKAPSGVRRYIEKAQKAFARQAELGKKMKSWRFDTIAVHGIYSLEEALSGGQGAIIEPIIGSTSQAFRDADEMEAALSYQIPSWAYSRIHNPTIHYLESTLALLETYGTNIDASCLVTSSGMSAIKQVVEPLVVRAGNQPINFVSSAMVYGGTFQLFSVRMPERGVEPRWVKTPWSIAEWEDLIDVDTRFLYAEMPSNPQLGCVDIAALAALAHKHGIPLIIDSTVATPALLRPICHGADIAVHSLTKTIGSSGGSLGGAIIARHNLTSTRLNVEPRGNYALWLKLLPFRDSGPCLSPQSAFMFLNELRTLRIRMAHHSRNTEKVVEFLDNHSKVENVRYLGLKSDPQHELAKQYMSLADENTPMFGHLCSFDVKGGVAKARQFFDRLQLIFRATDLGRIKSVACIPAISTHQQQGEEGRALASIPPNMVRLCVGAEHPGDVIADLDQALNS